jgi:hypothetical protein
MRRLQVNSRILSSAGYDPLRLVMEVKFRISGKVYAFLNVSKEIYEKFLKSRSRGNFFNSYIKHHFQFMKVK